MQFSEIVGQQRVKDFLLRQFEQGRIPHAQLFVGRTGAGSLALALAYAQLLQCEHPLPAGACEQCHACRKAKNWVHPDIHFVFPTVGAKAVSDHFLQQWRSLLHTSCYFDVQTWLEIISGDAQAIRQGNITSEECAAIVRKLSLKTFEGKYKILLMWLPEYLGKEGNRLLKLIEEPPEQTLFLLVAENPDLILNTILSRCQWVKTDTLTDDVVTSTLIERRQLDPLRARQLAFLADGDLHHALTMADAPDHDDNASLFLDWLRKCWRGSATELVIWAEQFGKMGRENQKQLLGYGLLFLRELNLLVARGGAAGIRLGEKELQTAQNLSRVLNFEKISRLAELFNQNIFYLERNANAKILFLEVSIAVHRIFQGKV